MFTVGNKVIIKDNLGEELSRLGFDEFCVQNMSNVFIGTKQEIYAIWNDSETNQQYATIDLCVEIPIQCLELI